MAVVIEAVVKREHKIAGFHNTLNVFDISGVTKHAQYGYNNFNNLILLARWWLQKFIIRHVYIKKLTHITAQSSAINVFLFTSVTFRRQCIHCTEKLRAKRRY